MGAEKGNRLDLTLNQRAVGSTPTRPTKIKHLQTSQFQGTGCATTLQPANPLVGLFALAYFVRILTGAIP